MKNFKQLKIWQKGFEIAVQSFDYVKSFPQEQKFALANQITRSAFSIPSNIAEGSSRSSIKDYNRFLEIALGSCFELETQLLIAKAIEMGSSDTNTQLLQQIDEEQKMIMSFQNKVKAQGSQL